MNTMTTRPAMVPGVAAVALLVFGTRWGSYLGANPIFLGDVLLLVAVAHHFVGAGRRKRATLDQAFRPNVLLLWALLAWSAVRFLIGGRFDLIAVRDAVPYLYVVAGILAATALPFVSTEGRRRTARLLFWALTLHAAWVAFARLAPDVVSGMPVLAPAQGVQLFGLRNDSDTALVGVWVAWLFTLLVQREKGVGRLLAAYVIGWVVVLNTGSRAGLIAAVIVNFLAFLAARRDPATLPQRRRYVAIILPWLLVPIAFFVPQTTIGERLLGGFGLVSETSAVSAGAAGTQGAREEAWGALYDYTLENSPRALLGVGFGPDMMYQSGAGIRLVGTEETGSAFPRSPHNYWLGTFARLGLIGIVLSSALALLVIVTSIKQLLRPVERDWLGFAVALIAVSQIPIATLGVVLESPFGAVPYFWAAGVLLAYPRVRAPLVATGLSRRRRNSRVRRGVDHTHSSVLPSPSVGR